MNNVPAILRSLIIYVVCVPLAFFIGYLLTNPLDYSTFATFGVLALVLMFPLLLRYHYPWLVFSWYAGIVLFFLKGSPSLWLALVALSLGISVLEGILNPEKHFIRVPQLTWPLIFMLAVVVITARLTEGFGLRSYGGEVYGGRKYIFLIAGILGYFALTARRIPLEKARLYMALYFLGTTVGAIGDFYLVAPSWLRPIFWFVPPSGNFSIMDNSFELGVTRLGNISAAGFGITCWLMAKYGLGGVLFSGKVWQKALFFLAFVTLFLGGFRYQLMSFAVVFTMLFLAEGLHRTRALLIFVMIGMLGIVLIIPFSSRLPFTFQRTLAFLPLNISAEARQSAEDSTKWRIEMWEALLPQISQHLLLGEGYAISMEDVQMLGRDVAFRPIDASQQGLALAHDYHNGPISVVLPFGIWGVIALLWFVSAGFPVMYRNFRYGDPALRTINTFMWVHYLYLCFSFLIIGESLVTDMMMFTGDLGLSIALNGGVCRPPPQPAREKQALDLVKPFPRPHPAFQR
ncbi:MAG: O-antigen ligase family protein [Verrucomicrobiota bacterium]|jgi:hypothetical protein